MEVKQNENVTEELVIVPVEKKEKKTLKVKILEKIQKSAEKAIEKEQQPKTKGDKLKKIAMVAGIGFAVGFAALKTISNKSDSLEEYDGDLDYREVTDETKTE